MKKNLMLFLGLLLFTAGGALGQWRFVKAFPDSNFKFKVGGGVNNGLAVDPDGKIWVESFANVDTIVRSDGSKKPALAIYVFNPNGTQASFSPIRILSAGGVTDTLAASGYGMRTDHQGNILAVVASRNLWRINYKTGLAMNRIRDPIPGYASSLACVAADAAGEIFLAPVLQAGSVILDASFSTIGTYADAITDFGRDILVSKNGNDVYLPRFGLKKLYIYHSDFGSLGPYSLKDSILTGLVVETMQFNPKTGHLWVGSGNATSGLPIAPYLPYRWYAYNQTTKTIVDTIVWNGPTPADANEPRPRGIAFSRGGDTAYVAQFNSTVYPAVQMFVRGGPVSVERDPTQLPEGFTLSQNYPNPFNPTTEINFGVHQTGMTTLKVYDVVGREVATLVDQILAPGSYKVRFVAPDLPSGVYLYTLASGPYRLSKKMLLVK